MTKYAPRFNAHISVFVLAVLICLQPTLLSCSSKKSTPVEVETPTPVEVEAPTPVETEEPPVEAEATLWTLSNPNRSFGAFLNPNQLNYKLEDYLTLQIRVTNDAHILIFNWDQTGTLTLMFPNAYQMDNSINGEVSYTLPDANADYDFYIYGPPGVERIKLFAFRHADDSTAIIDLFPQGEAGFQEVSGDQRLELEKKVLAYLSQINSTDWTEDSQQVIIHAAKPPIEPPAVAVAPIIPEMFFQPQPLREDVIIDAGTLGKYRFSEDTDPPDVPPHIVRQELVDLLNALQRVFKQPMLITSGYHSKQHQVYLWAKWLSEHSEHIAELNRQEHPTWKAWVQASQELPNCPQLQSKHRTGEAVDFYWETLDFNTVEQREQLTQQILETGGTRDYTPEEQQRFKIPDDDNYLFAVTAHPENAAALSERDYFRVVYRPSPAPTIPRIDQIGTLLPPSESEKGLWALTNSESSFKVSLRTSSTRYRIGDYITLEAIATNDARIIIFNWDETGTLSVLLPNAYLLDNFVKAGNTYYIPDPEADFDLEALGPPGIERFKIIALRHNRNNRDIIAFFRTREDPTTQQAWSWEGSDVEIIEKRIINYLRQIDPQDWAVDSDTAEIRQAEVREDPGPPSVIAPDYGVGDTVYIQDGRNMYFGEVTDEVTEDAETVAVNIFNEELHKKLGDTVSKELVIGRRIEPPRGWGRQEVMLSFYRDEEWTFTTDVVVFEDYYQLPEQIDGKRVRGSRKVGLEEVRIPIPVSFESGD